MSVSTGLVNGGIIFRRWTDHQSDPRIEGEHGGGRCARSHEEDDEEVGTGQGLNMRGTCNRPAVAGGGPPLLDGLRGSLVPHSSGEWIASHCSLSSELPAKMRSRCPNHVGFVYGPLSKNPASYVVGSRRTLTTSDSLKAAPYPESERPISLFRYAAGGDEAAWWGPSRHRCAWRGAPVLARNPVRSRLTVKRHHVPKVALPRTA
jgi:hypothetical protein